MKVGDRVRIISRDYEHISHHTPHFGQCGEVTTLSTINNKPACAVARDGRGDGSGIWYYQHDLELINIPVMIDPEFSLDEMAEGEEVISQMG
jgi:hypothetical protein